MKKALALALCVILAMTAMVLPAAAEATVVSVSTGDELCAACDALTETSNTTIKLTKSITLTYSVYKTRPDSTIGVLPDGCCVDLNGMTLTLSNTGLVGKVIDSVGGGAVKYVCGNVPRLTQACTLPVQYGFEDLVTEIRLSSNDATKTRGLDFRLPSDIKVYANSALELYFGTLTIGSGTEVDFTNLSFACGNGLVLEAAKASDLAMNRVLNFDGVTKILLTADIEAAGLSLPLPAGAVLDYNGHTLKGVTVVGTTMDSASKPADPEPPTQPATEPTVPPTTVPTVPPVSSGKTYTVKDGDCLYAIARTLMGNGAKWVELYELNRAVVGTNARDIRTGMVLTIPA